MPLAAMAASAIPKSGRGLADAAAFAFKSMAFRIDWDAA
jgi:hypothetical protein